MNLSDFEIEVMHVLWLEIESTAPVIHKLIEARRPVAYSTVKTILDRLEIKGAVHRVRKEGRTIFFAPSIDKKQFRLTLIKEFVDKVFLGNTKPIITYVLREEKLSLRDIEYLEGLLIEKKKALHQDF